MYHPAAALHQPKWHSVVEADFQKIPKLLEDIERIPEERLPQDGEQLSLF